MLPKELIVAVAVAGLQEDQGFALLLPGLNQIFAQVCAAESIVEEAIQALGGIEKGGLHVKFRLALLPAQHTADLTAFQQCLGALYHFLHRKSPNLTQGPSPCTFSTKEFMVSENFTPSAAETHSTRVRPLSTPR